MIVSFCPYQFTLIGTDICGQHQGEIHSIRAHLKSGVWIASHNGQASVFHDWPGFGPQEAEAEILARSVALTTDSSDWMPNDNFPGQSLTEACMRRGGICSIISSSLGRSGPFILPYSEDFEKHAVLITMEDVRGEDHHYLRAKDAYSLTMMTGMAVRAMASGNWRTLGMVLDQAWRLRLDTIPQSVVNHYNEAMLLGAWGCSWIAPSVLLVVGDQELVSTIGTSTAVKIDKEGARPLALMRG